MIYKSRNGIGTRVILITLLFFFMLTDAWNCEPKTMKELEAKCQGCSYAVLIPNLKKGLDGQIRSTISSIKSIRKREKKQEACKCCVKCAGLIFFVALVLWLCVYGENTIAICFPCYSKTFKKNVVDKLTGLGPIVGWIIFGVLLLLLVSLAIGHRCLTIKNKACTKLEKEVINLLVDELEEEAIIDAMVKKIELELEVEEIVNYVKKRIGKHKEIEEKEEIREVKIKTFEKDLNGNKIQFKEFEEEDVKRKIEFEGMKKNDAGRQNQIEEIRKEEDVRKIKFEDIEKKADAREVEFKEMKEEEEIAREKKTSEVDMKYKKFNEEKQKFMESAKIKEETSREKKVKKEECLIDNIDVNLFIYAMVFVFALFAICTICNFNEEERTGEIIEV